MWPRVVEIMLAVWLALSPFIFRAAENQSVLLADLSIALLIVVVSGMSFWDRTHRSHLLIIPIALGLILWGRFFSGSTPPPPEHQNHIALGLLLLMFAIVPSEATKPPQVWRESC